MQTTTNLPPGAIDAAGGVFFLSLDRNDRTSIATTIENLINMLDDMEPDPDLEPYLGSGDDREGDFADWEPDQDDEPDSDGEPMLGASEYHPTAWGAGWLCHGELSREPGGSQVNWAAGVRDDREIECEDEGAPTGDDEYSLGWSEDASLAGTLVGGGGDYEADLGTTDNIDQTKAGIVQQGAWNVQDGEPWLGWAESHGKGIVGEQNCLDDRENDDEREQDAAEQGIADRDAMELVLADCETADAARYDGEGHREAKRMLRTARRPSRAPGLNASDFRRLPWA